VTAKGSGTPHAVRLETYQNCMRDAGLASAIRAVHVVDEEEGAREATLALLGEDPRPTAVFAGHDSLALGALAAVAEMCLTAREVSVLGYDNTRLAGHPLISLTSVDQSAPEMGQRALSMLLERLRGREEPRHHIVTPHLVVRSSSGPALADTARGQTGPHPADPLMQRLP